MLVKVRLQTIIKLTVLTIVLPLFLAFGGWQQSAAVFNQGRGEINVSRDQQTELRNKAAVLASFEAWKAGTGSPYDL